MNGCSTLRDSLIVGAGSGAAIGGVVGAQQGGDRGENTIKGAVLGGVVGGLASYLIHNSLEKRDEGVRRETLMNLEHYEVLGVDKINNSSSNRSSGQCYETKEVDGRVVSIPCRYSDGKGD